MGAHGPQRLDTFMRLPREVDWLHQIHLGWSGPDGSSLSTDTICGVRIGVTSDSFFYSGLPANLHDWRYRLARKYRLPDEWRKPADQAYRDDCIAACRSNLIRWKKPLLPIALARCHARYAGLRAGARFAWTKLAKVRKDRWHGAE